MSRQRLNFEDGSAVGFPQQRPRSLQLSRRPFPLDRSTLDRSRERRQHEICKFRTITAYMMSSSVIKVILVLAACSSD
ncbi:unnamed protein product [Victoria cruziana]